ncbi:MAG: tetratricopeptide repeat protein [Ignavibacteria bacterium]|nr:tetratricopeptide repeat protein [Ignavibacteria bacterium]
MAHDAAGIARITGNMGVIYQCQAEYAKALQHFREALAVHKEMGNRVAEARVTGNMGNIYLNLADYPAALEQYQGALKLYSKVNDAMGEATVTGNLGIVYSYLADNEAALVYYLRAHGLHKSINDLLGQSRVESLIASVYATQSKHDDAITYCNEAIAVAKSIGARDVVVRAGTIAARSLAKLGRMDEAAELLDEMDALSKEIDSASITLSIKLGRAEYDQLAGHIDKSVRGYVDASELAKSTGKRGEEADCHKVLCTLYEQSEQWEKAYRSNVQYHELRTEISGEEQQRRLAVMKAEKDYESERAAAKREKDLLATILPSGTVERILAGEEVIADRYEGVAILFADIVGFTTTAATLSPDELIELLNSVFQNCDRIMKKHKCTRVKTIGDAYMAICGAPDVDELATFQMCKAAIELAKASTVALRIGVHYGPVVAGVIGTSRAAWDVWGDTVNVAARLESAGQTGLVHVSESVIDNLKALEKLDTFTVEERGEVLLKGKGKLATFWIL